MKCWLFRVALGLCAAVAVRVSVLPLAPRGIMALVLRKAAAQAGRVNRSSSTPVLRERSRDGRFANPDLVQSTCSLDLSHGPVQVFLSVPHSTFSLTLIDAMTHTVYALTDRDAHPSPLRLYIAQREDPAPLVSSTDFIPVRVSTNRALVLFRALAVDPGMIRDADTARRSLRCGALPPRMSIGDREAHEELSIR